MAKIGRNQPCPCGSGKKYKRCCYRQDNLQETQAPLSNVSKDDKKPAGSILHTTTGEPLNVARLVYKIYDGQLVKQTFQNLHCMRFDEKHACWQWDYADEAIKLEFTTSHHQIPKEMSPVNLSRMRIEDTQLTMDFLSHNRLMQAIDFFNQYLPRTAAKATEIFILNQFFSVSEENAVLELNFNQVFKSSEITQPSNIMENALQRLKQGVNDEEKDNIMSDFFAAMLAEKLPKVESLPIHYYEDGLDPLRLSLMQRRQVILQHFSGNTDYTLGDATLFLASQFASSDEFLSFAQEMKTESDTAAKEPA